MRQAGWAPVRVATAAGEVGAVAMRLRPRFRRRAAHRHARAQLRGLLGDVGRTNGWQRAEHAGCAHRRTIRHRLDRSAWDADAVPTDLRAHLAGEAGDSDAVLVVTSRTTFSRLRGDQSRVGRARCPG